MIKGGRRSQLLLTAVLASSMVALAACSSTSATASSEAASKLKGSPVSLYTIADENTNFQNEPEVYGAAQAAALSINNSGGINGHPIEITNCNGQAQANIQAGCARQIVADHAAAVVGYQEVYGDNINPIFEAANIPMVGSTPEEATDLTSPITFSYNSSIGDQCSAVAVQFAKMGFTKVGYLELNNPLAVALGNQVDAVLKQLKTPSGQSLRSYVVSAPLTAADYTPYVAELQKDGVQGVILLTAASAGGAAMTAASDAGYKMVFGSTAIDFTKQAVLGSLGNIANGFIGTSPLPDPSANLPGVAKFKADMAAASKAGIANTGPNYVDAYSLNAWLSVYAVAEAAESIKGDVTNSSLVEALKNAKDLPLQGLTPPWTPSKPGPASEPRISNLNVWASQYKNGAYQLLGSSALNLGPYMGVS
jgi:ABC-type branched-subunit amino acid transport system substrate-binding protein